MHPERRTLTAILRAPERHAIGIPGRVPLPDLVAQSRGRWHVEEPVRHSTLYRQMRFALEPFLLANTRTHEPTRLTASSRRADWSKSRTGPYMRVLMVARVVPALLA